MQTGETAHAIRRVLEKIGSLVDIQDIREIGASRPEAYEMLEELNIHSVIVLPLRIDNRLLGFIGMENYNTQKVSDPFSDLNSIAYFAAYALRVTALIGRLEKTGYTDSLTDTWNYNRFLQYQDAFYLKYADPVGVVFLDIDDIKRINGQYGHAQGDAVRADLPRRVRDIFRKAPLYRVGGEEFLILCEGISEKEFYEKVQRLKDLCRFPIGSTFSVGAGWEASCDDLQRMITAADQRMYQNKKDLNKAGRRNPEVTFKSVFGN